MHLGKLRQKLRNFNFGAKIQTRSKLLLISSANLNFAYFVELCHFDDGNRFSICNMSSSWWFQRNWTNIWKASSNLFLQFFRKQEEHWLGLVQKKKFFNTSWKLCTLRSLNWQMRIFAGNISNCFLRWKKNVKRARS